ncbi:MULTISPECIES: SigB/SigF/SigG family RNA polymerase sigma factor [unclassified Rhodococcus (in: high G+C Gram-positive bacteria)]|uniref:SigB/SigF/SigG family RNA polymerase sigma factor n=1 Tax=unclassified Rhodococcus (in: high G+C Gram-positive bacteria) TaxID=192944 RepID=UPI00163B2E0F|nr:SigB/SigF/SigG family RNA polymerase sigma factor [Rhodococcus sp. 3A]MBC2893248.1 SigB/SigF/SigG family RNA polymerase sigma factor [Rhodococcus sp. 4CII]
MSTLTASSPDRTSTDTDSTSRWRPGGPTASRHRDDYEDVLELFSSMAALPDTDRDRIRLRTNIIERCLPMAAHIALKFRNRGEAGEDLEQVARLALVKAVDRFDIRRGTMFVAFAVLTITGEIRRHFRDTGWTLHVPRRLQERHLALTAATTELSTSLGRAPTARELADALSLTIEEVAEGLRVADAYQTLSIDFPIGGETDSKLVSDTVGTVDPALDRVDIQMSLRPLLAELPELDRTVLLLRFYENLTQTQIAARIGVSQMQISRILARTLATLRTQLA